MPRPLAVVANWSTLVENFHTSALDFYQRVEDGVKRRDVPGTTFERTDFQEGGVLSAKREYLLVQRGRHVFAVCSAPFGTGQFFSWWLLARLPRFVVLVAIAVGFALLVALTVAMSVAGVTRGFYLFIAGLVAGIFAFRKGFFGDVSEWDVTLAAVPYFGAVYTAIFTPTTYYALDTQAMFRAAIEQSFREAMAEVTTRQGLRALAPDATSSPP